jgi:MOSC domain-containing protein YiiM
MRTKRHYENLLARNPNATIGFTLAAKAVYASRHGMFDANVHNYNQDEYRQIAVSLTSKYGENLTVEEVRFEMAQLECTDRRG